MEMEVQGLELGVNPAGAGAAQTPDMDRVSQGCPQHVVGSQRSCSLEAVPALL